MSDDGIITLHSHQYNLADEGVTAEIKRQTFDKLCFAPRRHKVLMRGLLEQSVRDCLVCLLEPGTVMSVSISITSLSHSHSDIPRLSDTLSACCSVCCFSVYRLYISFRGHMSLDCESPEPQGFGAEGTLGILFVPTTRVFPDKTRSAAEIVLWSSS